VIIDAQMLSIFNEQKNGWDLLTGIYKLLAGPSSIDTPLNGTLELR